MVYYRYFQGFWALLVSSWDQKIRQWICKECFRCKWFYLFGGGGERVRLDDLWRSRSVFLWFCDFLLLLQAYPSHIQTKILAQLWHRLINVLLSAPTHIFLCPPSFFLSWPQWMSLAFWLLLRFLKWASSTESSFKTHLTNTFFITNLRYSLSYRCTQIKIISSLSSSQLSQHPFP